MRISAVQDGMATVRKETILLLVELVTKKAKLLRAVELVTGRGFRNMTKTR
jgi:hypothetical protein